MRFRVKKQYDIQELMAEMNALRLVYQKPKAKDTFKSMVNP